MTTTLRTGSKGPDVKKLQELLNTTLHLNPALKIDGDFGRATNEAVKRFQAQRHGKLWGSKKATKFLV
jgi:peptidoglycan hydrolase-like protein with peptidoglycan-binding domain